MRIPVGVENDDGIGGLKIQSQPTGSGTQQKNEIFAFGAIEFLQQVASILRFSRTIQTKVLKSSPVQVVLHDIHERGHLAKQQDTVVRRFQFR